MQTLYFCVLLLIATANARRVQFNDPGMPIRSVDTSTGQGNRERIDYIVAEIYPRHVRQSDRVNFPTSGEFEKHYQAVRAPGDERGHLVASQFSGPPELYNLTPQNARVNRNAGFQCITTDWYGAECEVRKFLDKGGNRYVLWTVRMNYVRDSNRPDEYHLQATFFVNGKSNGRPIDAHMKNPFEKEDSTFWICRQCRSNSCTRQK